jgi:hypothetical protein
MVDGNDTHVAGTNHDANRKPEKLVGAKIRILKQHPSEN